MSKNLVGSSPHRNSSVASFLLPLDKLQTPANTAFAGGSFICNGFPPFLCILFVNENIIRNTRLSIVLFLIICLFRRPPAIGCNSNAVKTGVFCAACIVFK